MTFLVFLAGWLPFVNLYRMEPIPSFWVQWLAFVLAVLMSVVASVRWRSSEWRELTGVTITLLGLMACVLAQVYLGMVLNRVNAAFAVVVLVVGFIFHQVLRCQIASEERPKMMRAWALGVLAAGLCQSVAAFLGTQGLAIVLNRLYVVEVMERQGGAFGQPNQFGVFAVLFLASSLYLVRVRLLPPLLFVLVWVLGAWMCAASGSRAALCVWLLLVCIHFLDWRADRESTSWSKIAKGAGLWGLHALFLFVQVAWATRYSWLVQSSVGAEKADEAKILRFQSLSYRYEQFRDAWQLFLDRPFFGHGFEQFASARFHTLNNPMVEPHATNTHNLLTHAMVEFGLVGLAVMLIGFVWVLWGSIKVFRGSNSASPESRLVVTWVLGLLGYSMLEFPFHYTQFFFAFLLMSAFLPVSGMRASFRDWSIMPLAKWLVLSGALVLAGYAAVDFHRVQSMVLELRQQLREHGRVLVPPSLENLTAMRSRSVFPNLVDFHWVRALGIDGDLAEQKIEIAKHLFDSGPGGEQLAWYVVQLVSAGKEEEALGLMCNYSARSKYEFGLTMGKLTTLGKSYPFLLGFLDDYRDRQNAGCR